MSDEIESGGMSEISGIESKGDFVQLVWLIEKLRRRDGGCTMNGLIFECKKNFDGLEFIKEKEMINQQAPSADTCTEDKHIKGCKCEAPSATVDEKMDNKTLVLKVREWVSALCNTGGRAWSLSVPVNFDKDPDMLIEELCKRFERELHSQQPTVRVDALWEKHSTESREDEGENGIMYKNEFATAITEALRGSYSRESLRLLIQRARMISKVNGVDTLLFTEDYLLTQYDTERGMKNGKV